MANGPAFWKTPPSPPGWLEKREHGWWAALELHCGAALDVQEVGARLLRLRIAGHDATFDGESGRE